MRIQLNGQPKDMAAGSTVADLLTDLGLAGAPCAVEVNERLVRRAEHPGRSLADGDRVEVVALVGGG